MQHLLKAVPDMDAVFVGSDLMAAGAYAALKEAGLSVPLDLAVAGFDDSNLAATPGCWSCAAGGPGSPDGHQQRAKAEDHRGEPDQTTPGWGSGQDPQDPPADQEGKDPSGRLPEEPPAKDPGRGAVPERIDQPQGGKQAQAKASRGILGPPGGG